MSRERRAGGADSSEPDAEAMWDLMVEGSEELAVELGIEAAKFAPGTLGSIDRWVGEHDAALGPDELGLLGMFLARVLSESHLGGLCRVDVPGHPLEGEWALSGFRRGLAEDYCVPFVVSAARIGVDRSITAQDWYRQLRVEGKR